MRRGLLHVHRGAGPVANVIIRVVLTLLSIVLLYPFLYCLAYSLSESQTAMITNIVIFPVGLTLGNYRYVFANNTIINAFTISVLRTAAGVLWALVVTGLAAWAISKRTLPFNRTIAIFFVIPM